MKKCVTCNEVKELTEFYKNCDQPDGLRTVCKDCRRKDAKEYYLKNKEANNAYSREYYAKNKLAINKRSNDWERNNKERALLHCSTRRARLLNATPPWVDKEHLEFIQEIYTAAQWLSECYGTPYHVDHIEPLKGKNSSGLHVWWNLRAIPATDNCRKRNKLLT